MKDFLNQEIKVGDTVAYMSAAYADLKKGIVTRIGPAKLTVGKPENRNHRFGDQVVVVNKLITE